MPRVEEIAAPRLAQAIERDACILAEQMEQAYRDEIPEYRRKSAEFEAESRAVSEAAIGSAVLLLRGEVSEHELLGTDLWAGLGRRRAEQGFPLHAVVQSFQTGTRVMFARLHHEADLIGPDASLVLAQFMQRCVELLTRGIATLSEAYIATQLDLAEQRQRAADELLSDFTLGVINEATMTRAHAAGLRPAPAHQALVVAVTDFDVWRRVANGLGRLGCLCGEFGGTGVVLAPVRSLGASELVVDDLAAALGPDATVAAGPEGRGATGIKASLEEAGEILALARVLGRRGVVTGEEMRVPMLLHTAPDQAARFVRLLAPILEAGNRGRPLLETLRAYVATGGSIQGAAEVLFTHRNTVRARLARIEALLGWPLEGRRLELELGLVAYDLGITP